MGIKLNNFIFEYTGWIVNNYKEIMKINSRMPALRIISKKLDPKTKDILFKLQVTGKNVFPEVYASELIHDQNLLSMFSVEDKEMIAELSPIRPSFPIFQIISRTFERKKQQVKFAIKHTITGKIEYLTVDQIKLRFNELKGFDEKDAFLIGLEIGKTLN